MQCRCIRLYTLLLETFLMRDERHKKGRRAVKKVEWRHSKKSIRVKNGAAFCAGVCVCVGGGYVCLWETRRGADESLTSSFIRVRNELPSRIFLLTYLGEQRLDGWTDGWIDGWRKTEQREIGRGSTEVQCRGSFLHCMSRQCLCAGRQSLICLLWSHSHNLKHHQYTGNDQGNDAADMMDKEDAHCCFWHHISNTSSNKLSGERQIPVWRSS